MTRFPDAGHLVSGAGLCPRNDESAGKRRSTRVRKSGTWLKTALMTAAWAAVRVKTGYLRADRLMSWNPKIPGMPVKGLRCMVGSLGRRGGVANVGGVTVRGWRAAEAGATSVASAT